MLFHSYNTLWSFNSNPLCCCKGLKVKQLYCGNAIAPQSWLFHAHFEKVEGQPHETQLSL